MVDCVDETALTPTVAPGSLVNSFRETVKSKVWERKNSVPARFGNRPRSRESSLGELKKTLHIPHNRLTVGPTGQLDLCKSFIYNVCFLHFLFVAGCYTY